MMHETRDQPVLSAAEVVEWKRKHGLLPREFAPRHVLLCFQSDVIRFACKRHRVRRVSGLGGETYLLSRNSEIVIVRSPGPGAPAAVAVLEELVALGATRFISIGSAGGLQASLRTGDLIVPLKALRDDGTSPHYLPAEKWVTASQELVEALCSGLHSLGKSARLGCTWTTDAPYRETRRKLEEHRQEGIDTVEMEAAALFTAGQFLKVQVAAGLVVADVLGGQQPALDFDRARVGSGLRDLFSAALETFGEVE